MAPQDFRQKGGLDQGFAATPYASRETGRVKELAEMIFDDASFLAGVERIVTFRPKSKKTDGEAYLKELTHHIKASKETFKMMNTKDQLVDACQNLETELVAEMETAVSHAEASATAMADQLASQAAVNTANDQGTAMATAEERAELEAEKRRVQSQNLRRIEEQEAQLQLGIDQLEQERSSIRDEEHQKLKASLSKREADLEQRIAAEYHAHGGEQPVLQRLFAIPQRDEPVPLMLDDFGPVKINTLVDQDREKIHQSEGTQREGGDENTCQGAAASAGVRPEGAREHFQKAAAFRPRRGS